MKPVLVVDPMAIFREPIAASIKLAGYPTLCAADGEEALRIARSHRPHLIVLDIAMPNLSGIAFLRHLRSDAALAKTPVIILTDAGDKKHVLAAAQLGVKDYLLKSRFRLDDLLERIKKFECSQPEPAKPPQLTAAPQASKPTVSSTSPRPESDDVPRLLTREQFLRRVQHVFQTKTLSGVVAQVMTLASSPRSDMTQLARLIAQDAMLSARVLQAANSASYASAGTIVTTLPDAIRKIGCSTVRNVAAAVAVFDCIPEASEDGFSPIRCWQHSFAVAQLCERFASKVLPDQAGLSYVVGLCHDLGDIFIRTQLGKEYQQLTQMAQRTGRSKEQLHHLMFDMSPSQMISAVLKSIALPDAIRLPIETLHSPLRARTNDPIARILWLAENYANASLLASADHSKVSPLSQAFCAAALGDKNPPSPDPGSLRSEVLTLTMTLAKPSRAEAAKLLQPMFQQSSARIWVQRDPGVSEFDPISLALGYLAQVTVHDRLPTDQEIGQVDGIVILASSVGTPGKAQTSPAEASSLTAARRHGCCVLALGCDGVKADNAAEHQWRFSVALSDLADFAHSLQQAPPNVMAA